MRLTFVQCALNDYLLTYLLMTYGWEDSSKPGEKWCQFCRWWPVAGKVAASPVKSDVSFADDDL